MARTYPDTPAGRARRLRDAEDARLTARGHSVKWRRGHGQRWLKGCPGWTGRCETCGDVIKLAAVDSGVFHEYVDASERPHNMRNCTRRQRR